MTDATLYADLRLHADQQMWLVSAVHTTLCAKGLALRETLDLLRLNVMVNTATDQFLHEHCTLHGQQFIKEISFDLHESSKRGDNNF